MDKTEQILSELSFIERSEGVRVLFACESGSMSWGFASPDSDYDVRFVYVRPVKEYLRLEKVRDVIEWPDMGQMINDMDIVGWDLVKFLRLMRGSTPQCSSGSARPSCIARTRTGTSSEGRLGTAFCQKRAPITTPTWLWTTTTII